MEHSSCEGCAYAVLLSGRWCCDYLAITGHRRPCPPGEGCAVRRETKSDPKRVWRGMDLAKGRSWDTERARALYEAGLSDGKIAEAVGTTASAVAFWRRKLGLQANKERKKNAGTLRMTEAPPPAAPPPPQQPLALPKTAGPVELSVELEGRAFALRAPDLEGAAWVHEYAGRLLRSMQEEAE